MQRWYPDRIVAGSVENGLHDVHTIGFLRSSPLARMDKDGLEIAEFGIWKGGTSLELARFLEGRGQLHLFDYEDNVAEVMRELGARGFQNLRGWGCSYKFLDSYNWSLRNLIAESRAPRFDYVLIDGAHTWAIDALTFFLCDMLLKPGGYIDFADYDWRLRGSSLDPARVTATALMYTEEQIDALQVRDIVELLVRPRPDYVEVLPNKIFRKRLPEETALAGTAGAGGTEIPALRRGVAARLGVPPESVEILVRL